MFVGIAMTLMIKETSKQEDAPSSFAEAVVKPFVEFFERDGESKKPYSYSLLCFFIKLGTTWRPHFQLHST